MKKLLVLVFSCISSLMGMESAINLLKVPASQLPFNPFVPRVAWAAEKAATAKVVKPVLAQAATSCAMTESLMPLTAKAFSILAQTQLACRSMKAQAYVPTLKVLALPSKTSGEDFDASFSKRGLSSVLSLMLQKQKVEVQTQAHCPLMAELLIKSHRVLPENKHNFEVFDPVKKTIRAPVLITADQLPDKKLYDEDMPIFLNPQIANGCIDFENELSIPHHEQRLLIGFNHLATQAVKGLQEKNNSVSSGNIFRSSDSVGDDLSSLLSQKKIVGEAQVNTKSVRQKKYFSSRRPCNIYRSTDALFEDQEKLETLSKRVQKSKHEAWQEQVDTRQNTSEPTVIRLEDMAPDHQQLLIETGAISEKETNQQPTAPSWWDSIKKVFSVGATVLKELDNRHPGMC